MTVREPCLEDVAAMARVHVQAWQETYRGMMPDAVLDSPDGVRHREEFWATALTEPRYAGNRIAVAESGGHLVGVAMAGPLETRTADCGWQLYLIYLLQSAQGSGLGRALLDRVLPAGSSALLWVAAANSRAQAFYRRNGFREDGASKTEGDILEIRMRRWLLL